MSWFSIVSVLILRCVSSSTNTSLIGARKPRSQEPTLGSRMLSRVNFTSSAVNFSPLWKVTPLRNATTRLVLLSVHEGARQLRPDLECRRILIGQLVEDICLGHLPNVQGPRPRVQRIDVY